MSDQPLSQEMIDALLQQAASGTMEQGSEPTPEEMDAAAEMGEQAESPALSPEEFAATASAGKESAGSRAFAGAGVRAQVPGSVRPVAFSPLAIGGSPSGMASIDLLLDVPLQVTVELGRTNLSVREILGLGAGSVVELERLAGEPVDLLVNNLLIARGEVVVIDESFGIRVTEIVRRPHN